MAGALAGAGAQVTIVARGAEQLAAAAEEIGAAWESCDLRSLDAASAARLGDGIDILVNCAGVNHRPHLGATTEQEYFEAMAVNLHAPYLLGQATGPAMAARGWGRIINVGSQQTWKAFGNSGVYGVAKAGVAGLSRSQSEAWAASGVTSNTLIPGFVVTPMTLPTVAVPGVEEALASRSHIGRNGLPADFAGVAVWLASEGAAFVTGQTIAQQHSVLAVQVTSSTPPGTSTT